MGDERKLAKGHDTWINTQTGITYIPEFHASQKAVLPIELLQYYEHRHNGITGTSTRMQIHNIYGRTKGDESKLAKGHNTWINATGQISKLACRREGDIIILYIFFQF